MEWKNIWDEEPPRNEEIFFMIGDESIHLGEIFSSEKLRKCKFRSFFTRQDYECDQQTPYDDRVIYWLPVPKRPERIIEKINELNDWIDVERMQNIMLIEANPKLSPPTGIECIKCIPSKACDEYHKNAKVEVKFN